MPINTQAFGNSQAHSEMNQRDTGSLTHPHDNTSLLQEVKKYVGDARFPANKNDLVEHAMEKQAPSRIVDLLRQLPTPEFGSGNDTKLTIYNSIDELTHEIDRVE
jgi:hypothetical protein